MTLLCCGPSCSSAASAALLHLVNADSLVGLTTQTKQTYSYDYDMTAVVDSMARPDLQFTAPELISSVSDAPVSGATDVFSLACIIYRVLRKQSLFTAQTTPEYRSMLSSMHLIPVDGLPPTLQVGHQRFTSLGEAEHATNRIQCCWFTCSNTLPAICC